MQEREKNLVMSTIVVVLCLVSVIFWTDVVVCGVILLALIELAMRITQGRKETVRRKRGQS